ncbi:MAG: hypothetical protein K2M03_00640, partial [Muribaculaceae bacterium]|nr:hypothetical protein [Muribaculaceae bacterium]
SAFRVPALTRVRDSETSGAKWRGACYVSGLRLLNHPRRDIRPKPTHRRQTIASNNSPRISRREYGFIVSPY